jgi:hypothetical protein
LNIIIKYYLLNIILLNIINKYFFILYIIDMGAGPSQNNESSLDNRIIQDEKLIISPKYDSEKIFKTILDNVAEILSNDYTNMQYNDCNDMNFLPIKNSETIEFSDLKMVVEKANTKQKLLLAKTYKEKKDEKFTIRNIAELKELFFKNKIELNPEILKSIQLYDPEVSRNIFSGSVVPFYYIDAFHVNRLFQQLEYKNPVNNSNVSNSNVSNGNVSNSNVSNSNVSNGNVSNSNVSNSNIISKNENPVMSGGEIPQWMKKRDKYRNKYKTPNSFKKEEKQYSNNITENNSNNTNSDNNFFNKNNLKSINRFSKNPIENATFKSSNRVNNNKNINSNLIGNENITSRNNSNSNANLILNENANLSSNKNLIENENTRANTRANTRVNTRANTRVNTRANVRANVRANTRENTRENTIENENYNANTEIQLPIKRNNYTRNKSKINEKNELIKKLMRQLEEQKRKINNTTTRNKPQLIQQESKPVQRQKFYYSVRDNFKPINFCYGRTDTCNLSKYQLCQLISQYFTVKLNIIAAILSCIPVKNGDKYEGNNILCFKQLSNLDKCSLCVPYDYKDAMESGNKISFIQKIARYSVNLNKDSCSKGGYFFTISPKQAEVLVAKSDKNDINKKFFECRKKLNEIYYENLTQLIEVLNKLKNASIINNSELNSISIETKTIIDRMNTLCSYYYIYGTVALINADVSTDVRTGDRFFKTENKKNSTMNSNK